MGYSRAGFDVIGVDLHPQPHYPFLYIRADALEILRHLRGSKTIKVRLANGEERTLGPFDAVHASPPCQAHTSLRTSWNAKRHVSLVAETRAGLQATALPYIIENVVGAPLLEPLLLCGTTFGLGVRGDRPAELRRHRLFESTCELRGRGPCQHGRGVIGVYGGHGRDRRRTPTIGVYGGGHGESIRRAPRGQRNYTAEEQREAMGIDWMTVDELSQAIPPAYTEYIGKQLLAYLQASEEQAS